MSYTKIKLEYNYGPKNRFYRIVLIKDNPDLFKLGVALGTVLGATFSHCFLFRVKNNISYVMALFMETQYEQYRYLGNYNLSDLPDKFIFEYDTGDGWEFDCRKYKEKVEVESTKDIILIEGKGQGIWEDNIYTLNALFAGEIDPDSTYEDEENGICKPWNFDIDKYGDFDKPLNIEAENKLLDDNFQRNYKELNEMEKAYIKNI